MATTRYCSSKIDIISTVHIVIVRCAFSDNRRLPMAVDPCGKWARYHKIMLASERTFGHYAGPQLAARCRSARLAARRGVISR